MHNVSKFHVSKFQNRNLETFETLKPMRHSSEAQRSRLTSPFNLPAPGRRQPLYVVFDFAETCVFVKQSQCAFRCGPLELSLYRGTPSPEVTGLYCRVPYQLFSRAPLDILLVYLCRFEVRFPYVLLRGFSWQRRIGSFHPYGLLLCVSSITPRRIFLSKTTYTHRPP